MSQTRQQSSGAGCVPKAKVDVSPGLSDPSKPTVSQCGREAAPAQPTTQ